MATQQQRREATQGAILRAARAMFAERGFSGATMDEIARAAGVAKGAVYHHFGAKDDVFEAVFEHAEQALVETVAAATGSADDPIDGMAAGARAFLRACLEPGMRRIVLLDGPAVLGWARWREIDGRYFGHLIAAALEAAMTQGVIARRPVEPLVHLLLGAATEAATACAHAPDVAKAAAEYEAALGALLEGLRAP